MKIKLFYFLLLLLLCSCKSKHQQDDIFLEINNKELEKQIVEYKNQTDSLLGDKSYFLQVYCMEVNDSTNRYVITSEISEKMLDVLPYHFVCKVDGQDVYFTMLAGIERVHWPPHNFFKLKQSVYEQFMKKHFPENYKTYMDNKRKKAEGIEVYETMFDLYEPDMYYLTFVRDKLVKKESRSGLPWF